LDPLVNIVDSLQTIELLGVSMMLIGSVLIVISVMSLAYSIVVRPLQDEMQTIETQIPKVLEVVRQEIAQPRSNLTATEVQSCKFCGESINKDALFCTACGKAQR
jgi:hypothetical protein